MPVQACGAHSIENANYCHYPTGVHNSCGDCKDLHLRYSMTGVSGVMSNGVCTCNIVYTDSTLDPPGGRRNLVVANPLVKPVWDSSCPKNFDGCTTNSFEAYVCSLP